MRFSSSLVLAALLTSSCSNPDAEKRRHVERGDHYAAEKRDEFAVIEYANAVKLDSKFGEARFKLAQAYERLNNLPAAFPEYIRAADALPNDRDAQMKAAHILLLNRRFDDAKSRVAALLERNPRDVEALLLHANALAGLRDPASAIAEIEEALEISPDNSRAFINLGKVRMQSGEAKAAEAAFRKAIAVDPTSIGAKLALANFLWSAERTPEAETALKDTLVTEPQNLLANRMLALLYLSTQRVKQAEQPLKAVADISKAPAARLELADYYASEGRFKDAESVLVPMSSEPSMFAETESRLAALDYASGRVAEAHKRLDAVLARTPNMARVLVMKAQWLTKEQKLDEALHTAKAAVAAAPESPEAHFALAVVYDRRRDESEAVKSYSEVLRLNPRATVAQVGLSRLSLTSGGDRAALRYAEEARRGDPANPSTGVALARSLIAAGNLARAEAEITQLLKAQPNAAVVHAVNGTLQASKRDTAAARKAFERALELSPGFLEALAGLTYLDLAAKAPAQAIARLEQEIARQPTKAEPWGLMARAQFAAGDQAKAEQALRRAVTIDPRFTPGYAMLAELYMQQKRLDQARAEFEGIAQRDPSAVGARTMVGILLEAQGKRDEARKSYEATVSGSKDAPAASNNLAYIYAEQGTNLDVALELATAAKRGLPDDPGVDDTIGWVYYKKDLPAMAVRPLEDSLKKLPDSAAVLYHLGLTYAKLGDKAKAREALERSLKIDPSVGGEQARRVLASVSS
jgi:tetratricopeptide (TPR) repeat protein